MKKICIAIALFLPFTSFASTVMSDDFNSYTNGQTITDNTTYTFANFPLKGGSGNLNPSTKWETDSGWLYSANKWGYSGKPINWNNEYFFRLNTQAVAQDPVIDFDYKTSQFGVGGYPVQGSDATEIWVRFQSQYWTYIVSFDKTNNCIVAKRKVPSNDNGQWGGLSNQIANKGVYYTLKTDSNQPTFGAGLQCISWAGLNLPPLAHDGTDTSGTSYHFKVTATTIQHSPFNYTQIQLFLNGKLITSWTDKNDGTSANGNTFQHDWDAGYYTKVTGYNPQWGFPITSAGKTGIRADNIQTWIDNYVLQDASTSTPPPVVTPPVVTPPVITPPNNVILYQLILDMLNLQVKILRIICQQQGFVCPA